MPNLSIIGISKKVEKQDKSNPLRNIENGSKNIKTNFCCISTPLLESLSLLKG